MSDMRPESALRNVKLRTKLALGSSNGYQVNFRPCKKRGVLGGYQGILLSDSLSWGEEIETKIDVIPLIVFTRVPQRINMKRHRQSINRHNNSLIPRINHNPQVLDLGRKLINPLIRLEFLDLRAIRAVGVPTTLLEPCKALTLFLRVQLLLMFPSELLVRLISILDCATSPIAGRGFRFAAFLRACGGCLFGSYVRV